ncbi:mitogen-activated protein kinase kinase kinase YODA-like [Andrographis paniculata]|uniref:mitogen-activated protein kinase kinase kinase YODA-like n=1 Tax=Andrographis paniculata TaxID=175694 RepID=UPI0021E85FAC|nr:mitogen-activated protein kinase kinase kinase YODA-like [Andrographis paniculata]
MPSWWGRSSSKESKKKPIGESFIDTLHKKFKSPESKSSSRSGGSRRRASETVSERVSQSRAESRSASPLKHVARCQSFSDRPQSQPLPLPGMSSGNVSRTDSGIGESAKPKRERTSKTSLFRPCAGPACIRHRLDHSELDAEFGVTSFSSECSVESDDLGDSHQRTPPATDYDIGIRTASGSPSSNFIEDHSPLAPVISKESPVLVNLYTTNKNVTTSPSRRRPLNAKVAKLQVPRHGAFCSAPDSSMSSPSRSPMRPSGYEQVMRSAFAAGKVYADLPVVGSAQCSSPGSAQTSGHNSMVGDISGQTFRQPSRGSPEYSPNPSPRLTSPAPGSRTQSGAVTPVHPRVGGSHSESPSNWHDDAKQSHPLPLPPLPASNSFFSHPSSAGASPSVPRSPGRADNMAGPVSRWKKGKLIGRGTFGHVYVGFNSETGEMCAMKEVTLFADDAKSRESAKQLGQEIAVLSRLKHPNIVQYYGSETVSDKLYIYLEYVSGGSIHKILQEYGKLGESAIRSYTKQILSGLVYLHAKNTVHRDIKGANILVDPNGRVKLADFGMAKHIAGQSCPLSFKGSPYWMAPEVIKNSNGCSLAVDIWSLGCTVLEMATSKPPWSQYEGVAAMFKIGNSKELPTIPDHLSDEGKEFVRLCLQRNSVHRPTAAQLLEHPFVKNALPPEKQILSPSSSDHPKGPGHLRSLQPLDTEKLAIHSSRVSNTNFNPSEIYMPRNISCPVSPIGSPLLQPRSPQNPSGRMSPSPISSPHATSGASTPLTGCIGAIPLHNQYILLSQEHYGGPQPKRPPPCPQANSSTNYWDPDILGKHLGRTFNGDLYEPTQSFLADRVSLRVAGKFEPSPVPPPLACHRMT